METDQWIKFCLVPVKLQKAIVHLGEVLCWPARGSPCAVRENLVGSLQISNESSIPTSWSLTGTAINMEEKENKDQMYFTLTVPTGSGVALQSDVISVLSWCDGHSEGKTLTDQTLMDQRF
ncbi:hypothetical protein CHARACLAT_023253 [Characodon lateralis]|uniref:Uncharacterized protein n=1 Tax=Characodon lateralis TaxID=208331 RepID=A0ABU7DU56_9TELE|nr:hypothetical protein [Characodon lateralis]